MPESENIAAEVEMQRSEQAEVEVSEQVKGEQAEAEQVDAEQVDAEQPTITPGMQWCIIRTTTNTENRVMKSLASGRISGIGRVLVPTVAERRARGGESKVVERRLYPGYVWAEIALEDGQVPDDVWYAIGGISGCIGVLGDRKPARVSEEEAAAMLEVAYQKEKRIKGPDFAPGDMVAVRDGSFEGYEGVVERIDEKKCMATVDIVIFGRSTPVDIEVWALEKTV